MNEQHVIAAILTAGLLARSKEGEAGPSDAVSLYAEVLAEYLETTRPQRELPPAAARAAGNE